MKPTHIQRHFAAMGARFRISTPLERSRRDEADYTMGIGHDGHGEFFSMRVPGENTVGIEADVLHVESGERHLLLLARVNEMRRQHKARFLCGHDERAWFVAAVPGNATTVAQAREALKPGPVRAAQSRARLATRKGNLRHNGAFRRQGEWFFVPAPALAIAPGLIHRDEPIRRGNGKPHIVAEIYRIGGERIYFHPRHPHYVQERELAEILRRSGTRIGDWRLMLRNPEVYARGTVRHADHRTITLHGWHRVHMNTENEARTSALAFLD